MTFGSKDRFWFFLFLAAGAIIGGLLGNFLEASQFFGAGTAFLIHKYQALTFPLSMWTFISPRLPLALRFLPIWWPSSA